MTSANRSGRQVSGQYNGGQIIVEDSEDRPVAGAIDAGDICLSADLGTAYSKCATQRGPGSANPVEFEPGRWVLNSDLVVTGDRVSLALRAGSEDIIQDVK